MQILQICTHFKANSVILNTLLLCIQTITLLFSQASYEGRTSSSAHTTRTTSLILPRCNHSTGLRHSFSLKVIVFLLHTLHTHSLRHYFSFSLPVYLPADKYTSFATDEPSNILYSFSSPVCLPTCLSKHALPPSNCLTPSPAEVEN